MTTGIERLKGLEFEGAKVSGMLRLETERGSILIEIKDARIIGEDVIHDTVLSTETVNPLKAAYQKLASFLETLPEGQVTPGWIADRKRDIKNNGEESLMGIFPQDIKRRTQFLTGFFNAIRRNGIKTKSDLLKTSIDEIASIKTIGNKGTLLASLLQEILIAEKKSGQKSD